MKNRFLKILLSSSFLISSFAFLESAPLSDIQINGNQRIESETILSYVPIKKGEEFSDDQINETLKALYATGYFTDVKVSRSGNAMAILVEENPVINRIEFEGNSKLKDADILLEIKLRPREVLTRSRIQEAQQRMLEIYRRMGCFGASVNPQIIKLEQNRVDLVFEIDEGAVTYIRKITFIGNKAFKSKKLEEQLKSQRAKWYRFFAVDDVYDPDRFMSDQQELRKFYYDNGYPDVRIVAANAELSPDQKDFFLTFQIDEGQHYNFGKMNIASKLPNVKIDDLKAAVTFAEGDTFSGKQLERSILQMTTVAGTQGYAFVAIEPIVKKNPETKTADITFEIKEGPRVYIEKIIFQGNDRTRDHVLRREMAVHEGDAYNSERIKASERNLKNLNYFKKVEIETEPGSAADQAQILAKVDEQPTGEIGFSGGYSTLDGPLAQIKFVERNLMGTGRVLSTDLAIAKKRQDFNIGIMEPYFLGRNMVGNANIFSTRSTLLHDITQTKIGFSTGISYHLTHFWQQALSYSLSLENVKLKNQGNTALMSPYLGNQSGKHIVSALTHVISYDRRDNFVKPTEGYKIDLSTTFAGVGGTVSYLQNILSGGWYYSIVEDVVFFVKAQGGDMRRMGRDIRQVDKFALGANSFRGFEYQEIGPRDAVTNQSLGGTRFWTATAELTFPIGLPSEFGVSGAVFTDVGSLWRVGPKKADPLSPGQTRAILYDDHSVRASVGCGLSWDSPFGPISIDYARTVRKQKKDVNQSFLFGFTTRY